MFWELYDKIISFLLIINPSKSFMDIKNLPVKFLYYKLNKFVCAFN